ncbi:hypothetical protein MANES_06G003500v8 [Manihot esculenta]|uniref:Uncharacterized protein n=1 Tax=Manihot esculenta TaxID=3983 RepID=A0A2C9VLM0_MANES|nr:hypothetical protein MANES_06G003500v8 [Manihot esculenta]
MEQKIVGKEDFGVDMGFPLHSQVIKIKQESNNKIMDWSPGKSEIRPVLKEINGGRHLSRSPLGLGARPISVGDS